MFKFDYSFWNGGGWYIANGRGFFKFIKDYIKYSKKGYDNFTTKIGIYTKNGKIIYKKLG